VKPAKQEHPQEVKCPICDSDHPCPEVERWAAYTLHRCPACDTVFADPMESAGSGFYENPGRHGCACLDKIYGERKVVRKGWESLSQNGRLLLRKRPLAGGKLLDIGCGEGLFLYHAKRHYDVTGIDIDRDAVDAARHIYGLECVHALSLKEFSERRSDLRFDVVTMFDVLEHLDDPVGHMEIVRNLLTRRGVLVVSLPNRERKSFQADKLAIADYPPNHMTRWNGKALGKFITDRGFDIRTLYSRRSDWYGFYESGDILRYRLKAVFNPIIRALQRKRSEDGDRRTFYEDTRMSRVFKICLRSVSSLLWFPLWLPFRIGRQSSYGLWLMAQKKG
jgi:SAM-dependent methyltransferase